MPTSKNGIAPYFATSLLLKGISYFIMRLFFVTCSILLLSACQSDSGITEDSLAGVWISNQGVYVRLEADGTLTAARSLGGLSTNPQEKATFRIEDEEFVWISNTTSFLCKGDGRYKITLGKTGELRFSVIEDRCQLRREDLESGPMKRISK